MNRKKKLMMNTVSSLTQQIVTIICGFILPRYMLASYGSAVNGLVSSVTQFLSFISFLQMGVGAVVQASWYKPLANKDEGAISAIYLSAEKFFRKIAWIFIGYIAVLCIVYPFRVKVSFSYCYVVVLIVVISISMFVQYYFGITNQLLIYADQKAYVYLITQSVLVVLNTLVSVILMKYGASVQLVKFGASLVFAINPLILSFYVRKRYRIDKEIKIDYEPIKQKWNGFAQHLASVVMDSTDVIILTCFSALTDVSVYYVYHLVVYGIRQVINSLTVGIQSMFGNMLVLEDIRDVDLSFSKVELIFHFIVTFLFSVVMILVVPFVLVYTNGITDTNYNVPVFGILMSIAFASYCYRLPYYSLIKAAGHFKETQSSALVEVFLNVLISIVLVIRYGIVGVAIGTLVANIYRTFYFVQYLRKNILNRSRKKYVKLLILDIVIFLISYLLTKNIRLVNITYGAWIILAIKITTICLFVTLIIMVLGNISTMKIMLKKKWRE